MLPRGNLSMIILIHLTESSVAVPEELIIYKGNRDDPSLLKQSKKLFMKFGNAGFMV